MKYLLRSLIFTVAITSFFACGTNQQGERSEIEGVRAKTINQSQDGFGTMEAYTTLSLRKETENSYCAFLSVSDVNGKVLETRGLDGAFSEKQVKESTKYTNYLLASLAGLPVGAFVGAYTLFNDSWWADISLNYYGKVTAYGAVVGAILLPILEAFNRRSLFTALTKNDFSKVEHSKISRIWDYLSKAQPAFPSGCQQYLAK